MKTYKHYIEILEQSNHILIGGSTGSGKSVLLNNLIYTNLLIRPNDRYIFIDPKKVELSQYRNISQCFLYADALDAEIRALKEAIKIIDNRYRIMQHTKVKEWEGPRYYIIIDELADLMTSASKKQISQLIQRILQIGRAARVYIIACTQSVHYSIIPTYLKINFNTIIALKVRNKKDSNLLIDRAGAENLPQYGQFILLHNASYNRYYNNMIDADNINQLIKFYQRRSIFQKLWYNLKKRKEDQKR